MDPETLDTRKRKRIVEATVSGFPSASHAKAFGQMIKRGVEARILNKELSVRASIAAPDTIIAVTDKWVGPTVLKLTVVDIPHQNTAIFIRDYIRQSSQGNKLKIDHESIREKPQPQTIAMDHLPSSFKLFNVG